MEIQQLNPLQARMEFGVFCNWEYHTPTHNSFCTTHTTFFDVTSTLPNSAETRMLHSTHAKDETYNNYTTLVPSAVDSRHEEDTFFIELFGGYKYPVDLTTDIDVYANSSSLSQTNRTEYKFNGEPYLPTTVSVGETPCQPYQTPHYPAYPEPFNNKPKRKKVRCEQRRQTRLVPRGCRLWEFIRDLLHDPQYNPSHIKWTDRRIGEFRLIKSNQIAKMWGQKKNNDLMTYEKLSRAMRYYYKRGILSPVLGKRLVYKFGANAHGWRIM